VLACITSGMSESTPVRRETVVSAPPETAFALFTSHIGSWWPLTEKNVLGAGRSASVAYEDGRLVERSRGDAAVWAEVVSWDAPTSVRLAFHPGYDPNHATDLPVTFTPAGEGTRVTLEQRHWERLKKDASDAERQVVVKGWDDVLASYRRHVDGE
jgi:uncharacterized protein YndB with AHSA1/START domain